MQKRSRRKPLAMVAVGSLLVLAGVFFFALVAGVHFSSDEFYEDATPADLIGPGQSHSAGDLVWLRGMRDTENPVALESGRVLYPTREEPRILVDCDRGCEGTLVGEVSEWNQVEDPPHGWAPQPGQPYRIVTIGASGSRARSWATRFAGVGLLCFLGGLGLLGAGVYFWRVRSKPAEPRKL